MPPGLYDLHVTNEQGISSPRAFFIGNRAEQIGAEPNDSLSTVMQVPLNTVVNGRLDIDTGPRVAFCVPAVVERGKASRVDLYGWNLTQSADEPTGAFKSFDRIEVELPASQATASWPLPVRSGPSSAVFAGFAYHFPRSHASVAVGVSDVPVVLDRSDNRRPEDIRVLDASGRRELAQFTDGIDNIGGGAFPTHHLDPTGRWVAPEDGRFLIAVRNLGGGVGSDPRRLYRLSVRHAPQLRAGRCAIPRIGLGRPATHGIAIGRIRSLSQREIIDRLLDGRWAKSARYL